MNSTGGSRTSSASLRRTAPGSAGIRDLDSDAHVSESPHLRDEDVRTACMAHLSILAAEFGVDIPYVDCLDRGVPFRGRRVPFLNWQKWINQAAVQTAPGAHSIHTA